MPEYDSLPNGLRKPILGEPNWGTHINFDIDTLDAEIGGTVHKAGAETATGLKTFDGGIRLPRYTKAGLPSPGTSGRLARVTDDVRGIWTDTGTEWASLSGGAANVKEFGAVGGGVADETAAVQAAIDAAGEGGKVVWPEGAYRVGTLVPKSRQVWEGAGWNTVLYAKDGTSYIVDLTGLQDVLIKHLVIDGDTKADVNGVQIKGGATAGSQGHTFEHVHFRNCVTGVAVNSGTTTQADKNLYIGCQWSGCTTGLHVNSTNAQEQCIIGGRGFGSCTTGIKCSTGTVAVLETQFQGCTTGILIDGAMDWIRCEGVIWEGGTIDIDGDTAWPQTPLILRHCVLQEATLVRMAQTGAVLIAEACKFKNGTIAASGTDTQFHEVYCQYQFGATYNPSGTNNRRQVIDINGIHTFAGSSEIFHAQNYNPGTDETAIQVGIRLFGTTYLRRVQYGADDSGGSGFRQLRIAN